MQKARSYFNCPYKSGEKQQTSGSKMMLGTSRIKYACKRQDHTSIDHTNLRGKQQTSGSKAVLELPGSSTCAKGKIVLQSSAWKRKDHTSIALPSAYANRDHRRTIVTLRNTATWRQHITVWTGDGQTVRWVRACDRRMRGSARMWRYILLCLGEMR